MGVWRKLGCVGVLAVAGLAWGLPSTDATPTDATPTGSSEVTPAPRTTTLAVAMVDDAFSPVDVRGIVGITGVTWRNRGTVFHSATTSRRPRWFDLNLDEGESGGTLLRFAGTFPYLCRYHAEMIGTLAVEPRLEPPGGSVGDPLTLVVAAEDPSAAGFAFDLQRRRAGGRWVDIGRVSAATTEVRFRRGGVHELRARLVDGATGRAGAWSPEIGADIVA